MSVDRFAQRYDPLKLRPGTPSLGWGLIGASTVARRAMVEAIRRQPAAPGTSDVAGCWIVGVFSHDWERGADFARELQLPQAFPSLEALLSRAEVHCVYISSHPRHHAELALAAMNAGRHVLCETPLALSLEDARAMQQVARQRGVVLAVNHALRADAALVRLRELLRKGAIGDVLGGRITNTVLLKPAQYTWRLLPNGGGVILDRTIHDMDLLRWLFGDEVEQVSALAGQPILGEGVEDDVMVNLRLARHRTPFQLHDSFILPHRDTCVEVYGSSGSLMALNCLDHGRARELLLVRGETVQTVPLPFHKPYWSSVQAFSAAVREHTSPLADAEDGVRSLQAALAVRRSIQTGRHVLISAQ